MNKLLAAATILLSTLANVGQVEALERTEQFYANLMLEATNGSLTAQKPLMHPIVGDKPWVYSFLKCTSCTDVYDIVMNILTDYIPLKDEHEYMDGKIARGFLHFMCYFRYSGQSCMRYV